LDHVRQDRPQLRREAYLVARQWCRLAWYAGSCLVMTIRLLLRILRWMVRLERVGRPSQFKQRTGLAIPAFDVMLIAFGVAALVSHLW
jgi:ABC-type spermidine/putrescine transport system permease subunit I